MSTAIRFNHVSKKFALHHQRPRSFQELAIQLFKGDGEAPEQQCEVSRAPGAQEREEFWALRDVSFTVEHGETVGIIGPNAAGKSTVLKLISRIVEPTSGQIEVNGRVGALLELGAGFHPDLSGRENIYLNGSLLGLGRHEIACKLDGIITFAELERFIDMPVKHYSSGMRMRLGFSIAAHIDPEILLVDEVLAVGDQNFQHKCLEHIMEMQREGVTICFVSHGLGSVRRLCSRAIWLERGIVRADGEVDDTISAYLRHAAEAEESRLREAGSFRATASTQKTKDNDVYGPAAASEMEIVDISLLDGAGEERQVFRVGEPCTVRLRYRAARRIESPVFTLSFRRNDGLCVCSASTDPDCVSLSYVEGQGEVLYMVNRLSLMEGMYSVLASVQDQAYTVMYDRLGLPYDFRMRQVGGGERYGLMSLGGTWEWDEEGKTRLHESSSQAKRQDREAKADLIDERRWGTGDIEITDVALLDAAGARRRVFEVGESWTVRLCYRAHQRIENPVFGLAIHRKDNLHICGPNTQFAGLDIPFVKDKGSVSYHVDHPRLMAGTYYVSVSVHNMADTVMYDYQDRLHVFKVCQFNGSKDGGVVSLSGHWEWSRGERDE